MTEPQTPTTEGMNEAAEELRHLLAIDQAGREEQDLLDAALAAERRRVLAEVREQAAAVTFTIRSWFSGTATSEVVRWNDLTAIFDELAEDDQ